MKHNDSYYMSRRFLLMCGYSVNMAARMLGMHMTTLKNRVRFKTIDHFRVNGRVFISDFGVASCKKMPHKKRGHQLTETIEIDVVNMYIGEGNGNPYPITVHSPGMLWFFVNLFDGGRASIAKEKQKFEVTYPVEAKEILEDESYFVLAQRSKTGRLLQVYDIKKKKTLLPTDMEEECFKQLKKDFLRGDYKKKYCAFLNQ